MSKRGRRAVEEERQLWEKRSKNNLRQNQSQGGQLRPALPTSAASPGHQSNLGTTNPEGRLPGFSHNMWRVLQIVFCFSRVIFLQNYSPSRRNPVSSHKQMGKCLTTSRLTQCQEKAHMRRFRDKAPRGYRWRGLFQVVASTGSSGCCRKTPNTGYTLFPVVLVRGVGHRKVGWFICSMLK